MLSTRGELELQVRGHFPPGTFDHVDFSGLRPGPLPLVTKPRQAHTPSQARTPSQALKASQARKASKALKARKARRATALQELKIGQQLKLLTIQFEMKIARRSLQRTTNHYGLVATYARIQLSEVIYLHNKGLSDAFEAQKRAHPEIHPCWAFHGSSAANLESIAIFGFLEPHMPGFVRQNGQAYGAGIYFASTAQFSTQYGRRSMVLAQILPLPQEKRTSDIWVIGQTARCLPQYLLKY